MPSCAPASSNCHPLAIGRVDHFRRFRMLVGPLDMWLQFAELRANVTSSGVVVSALEQQDDGRETLVRQLRAISAWDIELRTSTRSPQRLDRTHRQDDNGHASVYNEIGTKEVDHDRLSACVARRHIRRNSPDPHRKIHDQHSESTSCDTFSLPQPSPSLCVRVLPAGSDWSSEPYQNKIGACISSIRLSSVRRPTKSLSSGSIPPP